MKKTLTVTDEIILDIIRETMKLDMPDKREVRGVVYGMVLKKEATKEASG